MTALNDTEPHYVRCIKPNDEKKAFSFTTPRVIQQLRACGVLETVRISAAGYPSRWTYDGFLDRYALTLRSTELDRRDVRAGCRSVLDRLIQDPDKFQFGKTKIFFRAGQVAYLEKVRADRLRTAMTAIQACVRRWLAERRFQRLRRATIVLQKHTRGLLARRLAERLRQTAAALVLQTALRRTLAQRRYRRTRAAVVCIQAFARGAADRRRFRERRREAMAVRIQRAYRGHRVRREYRSAVGAVVTIQCWFRRWQARRELKRLRVEARSVSGLKEKTYSLENKVMEMQRKLDAQRAAAEAERQAALEQMRKEMEEAAAASQAKLAAEQAQREADELRAQLTAFTDRLKVAEEECDAAMVAAEEQREKLTAAESAAAVWAAELEAELEEARNAVVKNSKNEELVARLCAENDQLKRDLEAEQSQHQKKIMVGLWICLISLTTMCWNFFCFFLAALSYDIFPPQETANLEVKVEELEKALGKAELELLSLAESREEAEAKAREGELTPERLHALEKDKEAAEERAMKLEQEMEALRRENKELLLGGANTSSSHSLTAAAVDAGVDSAPAKENGPGQAVASSSAEEDGHLPLEEQLVRARTDVARLQLANTKLMQKITSLEKIPPGRRHLREKFGEDNTGAQTSAARVQALQAEIVALRAKNAQLEKERQDDEAQRAFLQKAKDPAAELKAQLASARLQLEQVAGMKEKMQRELDEAQAAHAAYKQRMEACGMAEVVDRNAALEDRNRALGKRLADVSNEAQNGRVTVDSLKADNRQLHDRIYKLEKALAKQLSSSGGSGRASSIDARLQEEIGLLINENLEMREQVEQLELRLKQATGGAEMVLEGDDVGGGDSATTSTSGPSTAPSSTEEEAKGAVVQYQGMMRLAEKDVIRLVNDLVLRLPPSALSQRPPDAVAHVLFMCVLFADHEENAGMLQSVLTKVMGGIKEVVMQNTTNLSLLAFWMVNAYRLLCDLKQFSGEPQFQPAHLPPPAVMLKTFDLQDYRLVLSDLLVQIYHTVVKHIEHQLNPLIVPALLEAEPIAGLGDTAPVGNARRAGGSGAAGGNAAAGGGRRKDVNVDTVLGLLGRVLATLREQQVHRSLVVGIFKQLFYIVNATMVNNMLLRKDFCHWSKGMQVRYNLTKLEEWAREQELEEVCDILSEALQITQLLQMNKSKPEDVDVIYQTCDRLNPLQIQKILTMYTPGNYEDKVPSAVIRGVVERGATFSDPAKLMMDSSFVFPATFPFAPTSTALAEVQPPKGIRLDYLEKI